MIKKQIRVWKSDLFGNNLTELPQSGINSLDQLSLNLPVSVYTTFRTYNRNMALRLDDHFCRLENSLKLTGVDFVVNRNAARDLLRVAINSVSNHDSRLRLAVTITAQPEIYLAIENLIVPSTEAYTRGVNVITTVELSRQNPKAKVTDFIKSSAVLKKNISSDLNEALLVNGRGEVLEGMTSNFFGIVNGVIHTAGAGVLEGITRSIVLSIIDSRGLNFSLEPVTMDQLSQLSEAFITSASRSILPVVKINELVIGAGVPGQLTMLLSSYFNEKIADDLEMI